MRACVPSTRGWVGSADARPAAEPGTPAAGPRAAPWRRRGSSAASGTPTRRWPGVPRPGGSPAPQVPGQLDPAVGGVDALPAGSGRPAETLDELAGRDDQPPAQAGAGRHHEVTSGLGHGAILRQRGSAAPSGRERRSVVERRDDSLAPGEDREPGAAGRAAAPAVPGPAGACAVHARVVVCDVDATASAAVHAVSPVVPCVVRRRR